MRALDPPSAGDALSGGRFGHGDDLWPPPYCRESADDYPDDLGASRNLTPLDLSATLTLPLTLTLTMNLTLIHRV